MSEIATAAPAENQPEEKPEPPCVYFLTDIGRAALGDEYSRFDIDKVQCKKTGVDGKVLLHATDARCMAFVEAGGNADCTIPKELAKKQSEIKLQDGKRISSNREWDHNPEQPAKLPDAITDFFDLSPPLSKRTVISLDARRLYRLAKALCSETHGVKLFIGGSGDPIGVVGYDDESNPKGVGVLMPIFDQNSDKVEAEHTQDKIKEWEEIAALAKSVYGSEQNGGSSK